MTQLEVIENHLLRYKVITSWVAFETYGITRLSGIIYNLRKKYDIESENKTTKNRYGNKVTYCVYRLKEDKI